MTEDQIVEIMARAFSGAPFPSTRSIARARDALAALRSAGLTVVPESQWQPIETAPKDGTLVDIWSTPPHTVYGERIADARWGHPHDNARVPPCWLLPRPDALGFVAVEYWPTHWQPIPAPPASR